MGNTYRAVEISAPGTFRAVERTVTTPGPGQVRIRVEACGVCHSDAATVEAQFPGLSYPRVPGHEAIGRIEEIGPGVTIWKVGQRVGVGFFGGEDGTCVACRRGESAYCQNPIMTGITTDGGYAEMMIAEARALVLIPDELKSEDAAPLVCAGVTTFNALRNAGRAGDTVAIQGIGGLGHLGVQFARKLGFRTVAIGGGPDKEHLANKLGAHIYVDAKAEDAASPRECIDAGRGHGQQRGGAGVDRHHPGAQFDGRGLGGQVTQLADRVVGVRLCDQGDVDAHLLQLDDLFGRFLEAAGVAQKDPCPHGGVISPTGWLGAM